MAEHHESHTETRLNLYLISQTELTGYDTYDSAVVCAESEDQARLFHPSGGGTSLDKWNEYRVWASSPNHVNVEFLGIARAGYKAGVVCASFNAG